MSYTIHLAPTRLIKLCTSEFTWPACARVEKVLVQPRAHSSSARSSTYMYQSARSRGTGQFSRSPASAGLCTDRRPGYNKFITIHQLHSLPIEEIHHDSLLSYVRASIRPECAALGPHHSSMWMERLDTQRDDMVITIHQSHSHMIGDMHQDSLPSYVRASLR